MFDPQHTYTLENEHVKLIPLDSFHLNDLLPFSINEPDLWYYSLTPANGKDNLISYIQKAIADRKNGTAYPFVVYSKKAKIIVGSTRFYDIQPVHQTTQFGYTWYGKEFQGTKINKASKYLMLEFAFEHMKVHRVEFRADADNQRSIAAMLSIGCKKEGILRSNCSSPTGRRDSIVLSILESEWKNQVKDLLLKKIE